MASFTPSRTAGLERLHNFLPKAGATYARKRNYDFGQGRHTSVSCLSPWVRVRSITEESIIKEVLANHSFQEAEKYIQEVCWRTYWKGWLQQRPIVWKQYLEGVQKAKSRVSGNRKYRQTLEANSEYASIDTWVRELVETGYLHNHARMWFASIWIHTLKLPWELGAAFFMEHLLDGDCACNTLSWRWVAGRQTLGKTYQAHSDNILKYTDGRLGRGEVFAPAIPPEESLPAHPKPMHLRALPVSHPRSRTGLLLCEDDVRSWELFEDPGLFDGLASMFPTEAYHQHSIQESIISFRKSLLKESAAQSGLPEERIYFFDRQGVGKEILQWAKSRHLEHLMIAEPAVGFWSGLWDEAKQILQDNGIQVTEFRRPWDDALYPHARKGFFNLK
ncbi:MAG: FAD-binding domain-containing protein, partial [Verrucomicrobiota bacterium]